MGSEDDDENLLRSTALLNAQAILEARQRAERELIQTKERLQEETRMLELLNETAAKLASQLDLQALVQSVTDAATRLSGAQFGAFFYTMPKPEGGTLTLYTLSGAPREAFDKFGHPRATPLFAPIFLGQGVIRVGDVGQDPRYGRMGPHHGMPKGHLPVRSYLAVPVISRSGAVIGGLFFGHSEPDVFTERSERLMLGIAAHAAIAIDNARLFQASREAEERQSRLVQELERTLRFSEMFVGVLGHDLRNPLSAITTAASVVLKRAESDRLGNPITRILSSAYRMSRMIDQILDFTHVRLGKGIPLQPTQTDLAKICRSVIEELKGEVDVRPDVRLEVRDDPTGLWDSDRLFQLMSNLLGNAMQHRLSGTPVTIEIDGSNDDRVILSIENQGAIPAEVVPVIFDPYLGGRGSKRQGSSGLGLGLYISQQIVAGHGGSIRIEPEVAQTTRFIVTLPRQPPVAVAAVFKLGSLHGG